MPIVTIQSPPPKNADSIPEMLVEIRDTGAQALKCLPSNVWVVFNPIPHSSYVQGHSPIVFIKANAGRSHEEKERFVSAVASAVGKGFAVPVQAVWIHYEEMNPKDIWLQGRSTA